MRRSFLGSGCAVAAGWSGVNRLWARDVSPVTGSDAERVIVSVADFGAVPGNGDAAVGVSKAIGALPKGKPAALVFPTGDYHFGPSTALALDLSGQHDVFVDGCGSRWYFEKATHPVWAVGSTALQFRNIAIDWRRPPFSQGDVIVATPDGLLVDIRVDPEFPVDGSEPVQTIATFDRRQRVMTIGGRDAYDVVDRSELVAHQVLRLTLKRYLGLKPGDTVVLRHQVYNDNLFSFFRCKDIGLVDLTINAAPGMAVIGVKCDNVAIERFHIQPTAGTGRLMSTCADGIHLASCTGRISITNSSFDAMGDDAVNVHSGGLRIERRVDARSVSLAALSGHTDWPVVGDAVNFVAGNSWLPLGDAVIAGIDLGLGIVHFANDLPPTVTANDWLFDSGDHPQLEITNCTFTNNRARGVLAHRNAVIRGNHFRNQFEEAILALIYTNFGEGPSIEGLVVEGNHIEGANRSRLPSAAIRVGTLMRSPVGSPDAKPDQPVSRDVNHNVTITGNTIADGLASAIHVGATRGLTVEDNAIVRPSGPAVVLQSVWDARVTGNTCTPAGVVQADMGSKEQIQFEKNRGLSMSFRTEN